MAVMLLLIGTVAVAAQSGTLPLQVQPLPPGTMSIGLVASGVFPIVTSDVVGPDSPEGSHKRTTVTAGLQGGVEAAWEFLRSSSLTMSLRARFVLTTALDGTSIVHQHVDPLVLDGKSYIVTTDHGVRHSVQRSDLQALLGVQPGRMPVRFLAGVSTMVQADDVIEEIYHELSRVEVVPIAKPQHGDETSAVYRVTGRTGVLVGAELPFHYKQLEVSVHALADIGISTVVEEQIPTSSHLLSAGITCAWRF
ncbi:MAG: hypothetical protein FGM24_05730 [Candidatus Kapabacteria bacterium]|nr:hypothetical protein [Candidatus Kapabacteria bacterium]